MNERRVERSKFVLLLELQLDFPRWRIPAPRRMRVTFFELLTSNEN